jgi:Saxitoxin biosynthesis operon protein SxtJ
MKKNQTIPQVILSIVVGLLAISFIFHKPIFGQIALGIGILSLISAIFAEKVAWLWSKIGLALGYINGNILLTLIFFLVLTPLALLMKFLAKKDNLLLKKPTGSVFTTRNHQYEAKDMENVW